MKPLYAKDLDSFLFRFGDFVDSEIRYLDIITPTTISMCIACQDSARGFDWLTLSLEFSGVSDASLVDNKQLVHLDMSDGISLLNNDGQFIFVIKNTTINIKASSIKYEEGIF